MKTTKKSIIAAVTEKFKLTDGDVDLVKEDGIYYWGGKAGACFTGCAVYVSRIGSFTLERWVDDFHQKMVEALEGTSYLSISELINSIDWTDI